MSKEITSEYLDELLETLRPEHVNYLQIKTINSQVLELREELEKQAPSTEEIIAEYTENQYVEQSVQIMSGLKATFRTLAPGSFDESISYANLKSDNMENYKRILARRRLSHAIVSINGNMVGSLPIQGSYHEIAMARDDGYKGLEEELNKRADKAYDMLSYHGLADKISEAFGVWERIIYDRMNGIKDVGNVLKKSTRTSRTEQ